MALEVDADGTEEDGGHLGSYSKQSSQLVDILRKNSSPRSPYPDSLGVFSLVSLSQFPTDISRSNLSLNTVVSNNPIPQLHDAVGSYWRCKTPLSNLLISEQQRSSLAVQPLRLQGQETPPVVASRDGCLYNFPSCSSYTVTTPSTLQIRTSDGAAAMVPSSLKRVKAIGNLRNSFTIPPGNAQAKYGSSPRRIPAFTSPIRRTRPPFANEGELVSALDQFNAFYVFNAKPRGTPVIYNSEDVWAFSAIKDTAPSSLNIKHSEGNISDFINEIDENGNEVIYLALINRLHTVKPGDRSLAVASIINVTEILEYITFEEMECEKTMQAKPRSLNLPHCPNNRGLEGLPSSIQPSSSSHSTSSQASDTASSTPGKTTTSLVEGTGVLAENEFQDWITFKDYVECAENGDDISQLADQIIKELSDSLLNLYGDYFILSTPLTNASIYDMSHISPRLCDSGDYITGHLYHTPQATMDKIKLLLMGDERFSMIVKWGISGRRRRLYCVPLFGQPSRPWLCTLIDPSLPSLWPEESG
ncbi:predicted protein [Uncinocarpus reesii 1704]|uniref:Uncharacterized protein n=1 Tax=Uncinocarpus reesii (strain UAMH 1704) TaxID=336963 RepID=C4JIN2_UNCRE|nr:uncharacterized protein UREG_02893 [Uncinocarpus reesii 1704]EEP78044.1 predicted protein [Uncinocarpus reesii 1704]